MDIVGGAHHEAIADEEVLEEVAEEEEEEEEEDIRATDSLEEKLQGIGGPGKLYLTWENIWIKLLS